MLLRLVTAALLAAALVSGAAVAFLRTDFVADNLCAYAVATIEEATAAQVHVAACRVEPEAGKVTIEGLQVGDPGGRINLKVARVFAQVVVRPLLERVRLERLEIDHPELQLSLDAPGNGPPKGGQCLPDALERFELGRVTVRKASVEVRAQGLHVQIPHAALAVKGHSGKLHVAVGTRGGKVELPGRTVGLIHSRASADVDLRGTGEIDVKKVDLIGTEAAVFLKDGRLSDLCNPQIEVTANLRVDDLATATERLIPGVIKGARGSLSTDAIFSLSRNHPRVRGDLRLKNVSLEGLNPGDARLRYDLTSERVKVDRLDLAVGKGAVNGSLELGLTPALPLTADLSLHDLELGELLRKLGSPHSTVVLRGSGKAQLKGALAPFHLGGDTELSFADFAILDRPYDDRLPKAKIFELPRARLVTAIAIDGEKVALRHAALETGVSRVQVDATFFTDGRGMQLAGRTDGVDFADFREHLGLIPARGRAAFAARVDGPYDDLRIDAQASARDLRFMELALGDVTTHATVSTRDLTLALDDVRGRKDRTSYEGRVVVGLGEAGTPLDAHLELTDGYLHDLVKLAIGLVPPLSSIAKKEDVDGHVTGVIDVHGPADAPDGVATLQLDGVSLWQERFSSGAGSLVLHGNEPRLEIEALTLRHGAGSVAVSGNFGPEWKLGIDAVTSDFTLADLDPAAPAQLTGALAARAAIRGTASHPVIEARVRFPDGRAGKAALGAGDLALHLDGDEMSWSGTVGAHQLTGDAQLAGDFHYTSTLALNFPDLTPFTTIFAPDAEVQSGSATAEVRVAGSLLRLPESAGTIELKRMKVVRNDIPFENDGPAQLTFGPEGLAIQHLQLTAPYTTAQLSGARSRDGRLSLRATASIDGRLLQGLVSDVEHAAGRWLLQAQVTGTEAQPVLLGNLRVEDGEVRLRGLPVAARALDGSISFSQDALVIDSMTGRLNNGEARLSGGIELARGTPKRVDIAAHVSDVNVSLQESVGATVDGDLTLYGPPLEPVLGGSLVVSRLRYTEDIDLERSLLDFSRRPPAPKVLVKSAMLLHFDLDVQLGRGVQVDNNLARADLRGDLKLTGTSRRVGLLGSVNTLHGKATFRGNEFAIEQGVLTFTDRQTIRPAFDLQASTQVKEYKVRLHAFGTPGEPHLTLSSDPALADADLGFLLTFGFVSQNLQQSSFSAADSGLAIGVEALNKVTGFSEEVRRFIPKNAILRDPNLDFASDFSDATNRLEPMARFSSHLINDRLDLRVLEGLTTRRYRGVVSYQLSDLFSTRIQLDNEHLTTGTDFGVDLHLKWEDE